MRFIIVSALMASVALASPAQKRDYVTISDIHYVTEIVTVQAPSPESKLYVHRQHRYGRHTSTSTVIVTASPEPVPAQPEPTLSPEPSPSPVGNTEGQESASQSPSAEPSTVPSQTNAVIPTAEPEPSPTSKQPEPSPTPKETQSPVSPTGNDYQQTCLDHHNQHRSNHSAPPMAWDSGLEHSARVVAQTCVFKHKMDADGGGYGQNIAARSPGAISASEIAKVISEQFYNGEVELYPGYGSEPDMSNFHEWGHFSQVVWVDSTHVACVTEDCTAQGLGHFTVCNYKNPGNFGGRYAKNVLPPKDFPTLHG